MSGLLTSGVEFIARLEKLIVISITLALASGAAYLGERYGYISFEGLPLWVRPSAEIIFIVASAHIFVKSIIGFARFISRAMRWSAGFSQRRSQKTYDDEIYRRLNATTGIAREALSYALYHNENHIWENTRKPWKWTKVLTGQGLLERYDTIYEGNHYRINRTAWDFMRRHPHKFMTKIPWPGEPWACDLDEDEMEKEYKNSFG